MMPAQPDSADIPPGMKARMPSVKPMVYAHCDTVFAEIPSYSFADGTSMRDRYYTVGKGDEIISDVYVMPPPSQLSMMPYRVHSEGDSMTIFVDVPRDHLSMFPHLYENGKQKLAKGHPMFETYRDHFLSYQESKNEILGSFDGVAEALEKQRKK